MSGEEVRMVVKCLMCNKKVKTITNMRNGDPAGTGCNPAPFGMNTPIETMNFTGSRVCIKCDEKVVIPVRKIMSMLGGFFHKGEEEVDRTRYPSKKMWDEFEHIMMVKHGFRASELMAKIKPNIHPEFTESIKSASFMLKKN